MARHIRFGGLASIVVVEADDEIDALIDRPDLDRTYRVEGPPLNRLMISRLRRALFRDGSALRSFAPRGDGDRASAQGAFAKRVDALAEQRPWAPEAIAVMAAYVANGTDRNAALAALAYATAYPFLSPEDTSYEPAKFRRLFGLFEILQVARNPWKGLLPRLLGKDRHAAREILEMTGGDDYGLHAVGITLANSVVILDHLRALFVEPQTAEARATPLEWNKVRTSAVAVTRQNNVPCRLPGIPDEVPANSLILLKMRQALRPSSPDGFEFAGKHWSYCPASRYIEAIFDRVYDVAKNRA
ncbi:hypothetical protein [Hyphomicrobium sp.]|jgi:hypothetical protein|uniref:hypothetical protein n=1 Tax=Hyphomicrobium sp. TaxID=82 RepID=UPI0035620847